MCSIESALRHGKPGDTVVLWTLDDESYGIATHVMHERLDYVKDKTNLLVCNVGDLNERMFVDTPLYNWTCTGDFCQNNNSNALRLALLYKFGGTYLDMDIISMRSSASRVGNLAVGYYNNNTMVWHNNAFMQFRSRHPLMWKIMKTFVADFQGNRYGYNGPKLLDRVLYRCMVERMPECSDISYVSEYDHAPLAWKLAFKWMNSTEWEDKTKWPGRGAGTHDEGTWDVGGGDTIGTLVSSSTKTRRVLNRASGATRVDTGCSRKTVRIC